jgi:hypothetical protein
MNRFEKLKNMTIDELAEWFSIQNNVCEKETPCSKCDNQEWCNCVEPKEYKKWLEKEVKDDEKTDN